MLATVISSIVALMRLIMVIIMIGIALVIFAMFKNVSNAITAEPPASSQVQTPLPAEVETPVPAEPPAVEQPSEAVVEPSTPVAEQSLPSILMAPQSTTDPNVSYKNCTEVRKAGKAPIHQGEPGYSHKLDRDGDGVGCDQ